MPIFNINTLMRDVFGLTGFNIYFPQTDVPQPANNDFGSIPVIEVRTSTATSALGTPVFDQIYVKPINYSVLDNNNRKKIIPFKGYQLPDATIIEVNLPKIIVKTPVNGNEGTVKEYVGIDDYQITIRSIIVNPNSELYPEQEVSNIMQMFKVNTSLPVVSRYLNLLGIDEMVVESLQLLPAEGSSNIQPFVLTCISDRPYELKIRQI